MALHHMTLPGTTFHAFVDPEDIKIDKLSTKLYRSNGGTMSKGVANKQHLWPVVHPLGECDNCTEQPVRVR